MAKQRARVRDELAIDVGGVVDADPNTSAVSSRPTQDMREPSPESGLTLKNSPGW